MERGERGERVGCRGCCWRIGLDGLGPGGRSGSRSGSEGFGSSIRSVGELTRPGRLAARQPTGATLSLTAASITVRFTVSKGILADSLRPFCDSLCEFC